MVADQLQVVLLNQPLVAPRFNPFLWHHEIIFLYDENGFPEVLLFPPHVQRFTYLVEFVVMKRKDALNVLIHISRNISTSFIGRRSDDFVYKTKSFSLGEFVTGVECFLVFILAVIQCIDTNANKKIVQSDRKKCDVELITYVLAEVRNLCSQQNP